MFSQFIHPSIPKTFYIQPILLTPQNFFRKKPTTTNPSFHSICDTSVFKLRPIHLSFPPTTYLFTHLAKAIYLSICPTHPSNISRLTHLSICPLHRQPIHASTHSFIFLSFNSSIHLSPSPSTHPVIHPF